MKFFKKELCEKLWNLGCCSSKEFYFVRDKDFKEPICIHESRFLQIPTDVPAFSIYDFLSDEDYTWVNCLKIKSARTDLACIENQETYIEEAVDKILKDKE